MAARDPRVRGVGALGPAAVIAAVLLAAGIAPPVSYAQTAPELERAKDLYRSAEAAMKDDRFDDAARDYGASYELSKDPALFYKIGRANERAARCDIALIYYARYLREGKPTEQFIALTNERIAACHGSTQGAGGNAAGSATGAGGGSAGNAGSADVTGEASAGSSAADSTPADSTSKTPPGASGSDVSIGRTGPGSTGPGSAAEPAARSASAGDRSTPGGSTSAAEATPPAGPPPAGSGSPAPLPIPSHQHKVAWLLSGSAIALASLGGVLAYAARSSENDVRDLYAGLGGQPPPYDAQTRKRYDDLVDDGHRFEHLSWTAFGLAGAATVGAAVLFTLGGDEADPHARVTPVITTRSAGVAVRF